MLVEDRFDAAVAPAFCSASLASFESEMKRNFSFYLSIVISNLNPKMHNHNQYKKKVLLRERKRHTDRGVSSTTLDGVPPPPGQV